MFESIIAWFKSHKKEVFIATITAIVGTVAYLTINGQTVKMPTSELGKRLIPESSHKTNPRIHPPSVSTKSIPLNKALNPEIITVNIDGETRTINRNSFIRHLHEGWSASDAKKIQAEQLGVDLKPGETIVNPCVVKIKAK